MTYVEACSCGGGAAGLAGCEKLNAGCVVDLFCVGWKLTLNAMVAVVC